MGITNSPLDWYTARAAGIVAYLILTAVVLVGLTLSGQVRLRQWPKFAVTDVHRFGGLLVGVFVSIHVATIAFDSYVPFSLTGLVVPFASHYRPVWTALGIVSVELLVAIAITNALRTRVPYRFWRRIHVLNLVVWAAATAHGIGSGTDSTSPWMMFVYIGAVSSVLAALAWRTARRRLAPTVIPGLVAAAGLFGAAAVVVLAAVPHGSSTRHAGPPLAAFADSFRGSLSQDNGAAGAMVTIEGHGTGKRAVLLRIDLVTTDGQSINGTALQLKDVASGSVCSGTVSSITAAGFTGSCNFSTGTVRTVSATWQVDASRVAGNLDVTA